MLPPLTISVASRATWVSPQAPHRSSTTLQPTNGDPSDPPPERECFAPTFHPAGRFCCAPAAYFRVSSRSCSNYPQATSPPQASPSASPAHASDVPAQQAGSGRWLVAALYVGSVDHTAPSEPCVAPRRATTASLAPVTTRRTTSRTRWRAYLLMSWAIITPSGKMSRGRPTLPVRRGSLKRWMAALG